MADKDLLEEKTIAQDIVVTKYKMAGEMVNRMFAFVDHLIDPNTCSYLFILMPFRGFEAIDRQMQKR